MSKRRPRLLKASQLPFIVRHRWWTVLLVFVSLPLTIGLSALAAFTLPALPGFVTEAVASDGIWGLLRGLIGATVWIATILICLIAALQVVDRAHGWQLSIWPEGILMEGRLFSRQFQWTEIREIRFKLGRFYLSVDVLVLAHVGIYVDGSIHPKRHWSSMWFGYYDIPPLMEMPAKELAALLRHAKRRADAGWPDPAPKAPA